MYVRIQYVCSHLFSYLHMHTYPHVETAESQPICSLVLMIWAVYFGFISNTSNLLYLTLSRELFLRFTIYSAHSSHNPKLESERPFVPLSAPPLLIFFHIIH